MARREFPSQDKEPCLSMPGFGKDSLTVLWLRNPVSHSSFPVNEGVEGVSRATDPYLVWPPTPTPHEFPDAYFGEGAPSFSFSLAREPESRLLRALHQEVSVVSIQCLKLTTFSKHFIMPRVPNKNQSFTVVMQATGK